MSLSQIYWTNILVDTRATQTLVRKDLVSNDDNLDGEVTISCAHWDDTVSNPQSVVKINIGGKDIIMTAVVSSTLPASVLLGWNVPKLTSFITDGQNGQKKANILAFMARLQLGQQKKRPRLRVAEHHCPSLFEPVELTTTEEADTFILMILLSLSQVLKNISYHKHKNMQTATTSKTRTNPKKLTPTSQKCSTWCTKSYANSKTTMKV